MATRYCGEAIMWITHVRGAAFSVAIGAPEFGPLWSGRIDLDVDSLSTPSPEPDSDEVIDAVAVEACVEAAAKFPKLSQAFDINDADARPAYVVRSKLAIGFGRIVGKRGLADPLDGARVILIRRVPQGPAVVELVESRPGAKVGTRLHIPADEFESDIDEGA